MERLARVLLSIFNSDMRRFIVRLVLYVTIVLGAILVAHIRYRHRFPVQENYFAAADDKERILATNRPPRLIVTGGSSVAFGIDAELIGTRCGLTPVNMGLQLGLGLSFMLSQIEGRVAAGDVVVLALEYDSFVRYYLTDAELLGTIAERNPVFITRLPFGEIKKVMDRGIVLRVGTVVRAATGAASKGHELFDPIYYRRAFNQHGDLISYLGKKAAQPTANRFKYEAGTAKAAIQRLNEFHKLCEARGARVFLTHPPFSRRMFEQSAASIALLDRELREQMTIPMLDRPEDTAYSLKFFFDTVYHLNPEGRKLHSEEVAARLVAHGVGVTGEQSKTPDRRPK
jgi:hypothetical protein